MLQNEDEIASGWVTFEIQFFDMCASSASVALVPMYPAAHQARFRDRRQPSVTLIRYFGIKSTELFLETIPKRHLVCVAKELARRKRNSSQINEDMIALCANQVVPSGANPL